MEVINIRKYRIDFIKGILAKEMIEEKSRQTRKNLNYTDEYTKQISSEVLNMFK